jgi:hypothetical protein
MEGKASLLGASTPAAPAQACLLEWSATASLEGLQAATSQKARGAPLTASLDRVAGKRRVRCRRGVT